MERSTSNLLNLEAWYNNEAKTRLFLTRKLTAALKEAHREGELEMLHHLLNDEQLLRLAEEPIERFDAAFYARGDTARELRHLRKLWKKQLDGFPGVESFGPAGDEPIASPSLQPRAASVQGQIFIDDEAEEASEEEEEDDSEVEIVGGPFPQAAQTTRGDGSSSGEEDSDSESDESGSDEEEEGMINPNALQLASSGDLMADFDDITIPSAAERAKRRAEKSRAL